MSKRRVVVTGLGVVSSIGIGKDQFWCNLIAGKSGISNIEMFDVSEYPSRRVGSVKSFKAELLIDNDKAKNLGRASQFAVSATKLALEDASLDVKRKKKIGVVVGTTMADCTSLEQIDKHWIKNGEDDIWAKNIKNYPSYNLPHDIGFYFGIEGLNFIIPTACAAGNYSIAFSYDLIKQGKINIMIAGGSDPIGRTNFTGFHRLVAMSHDKCRPFDKNRKGMIVGEGSGILVLEELEHAERRGAKIYAEVLGYGLSCDAYSMTIPRMESIVKALERAMANSNVEKESIDYICAHGTGTITNDKTECGAIKKVFGDSYRRIPVSSIKSMLGHTMGAASAMEAISCCLTIKNNIIPPTINYETIDPECDIDCVPNKARVKNVRTVLNNSFAFGGNNACLILAKYE